MNVIVLIIAIYANSFNRYQSDSLIYWGHRLAFKDFQAIPDSQSKESAKSYVGFVCTYEYDTELGKFDFDVHAFFDPQKSWIRSLDTSTLCHEQVHFDIAELFTRKLKRELAKVKNDFQIDKKIDTLITKYKGEMKECQDKYDKETLNSDNLYMQKFWESKIKTELSMNVENK